MAIGSGTRVLGLALFVGAVAAGCAPAPAAAPNAVSAAPPPSQAYNPYGRMLYNGVCFACHATGTLGAPRIAHKEDWEPRLKDPIDKIYDYALYGKGAMPPRGGARASDDDVKAAVDYMISGGM